MLYLKIHNTVIEIDNFTMFHYQENGAARFSCTLSLNQSMDALDTILNGSIINGITIYKDSACTQSFWSSNRNFVLENVAENYFVTNVDQTSVNKYIDLRVC